MHDEWTVLARRWRAGEERLYPSLMWQEPERYERCVRLVRTVADELARYSTPEALVQAYGERSSIVASAVRRLGLVDPVDRDLVADAAFSLRYRELAERDRRADMQRRIERARDEAGGWVCLRETTPAGVSSLPGYERLEMDVETGAGLYLFVEEDIDTGWPRYGVQVVPLDPQTGQVLADREPLEGLQRYPDLDSWKQAVADLRRRFGGRG